MKFTTTIILNILFIAGISLETTARPPDPFIIKDNLWDWKEPARFATTPTKWTPRGYYDPELDGTVDVVGDEQGPAHVRIYRTGTNQFEIINTLRTPHLVLLHDQIRGRWLELSLRVPRIREDGTSVPTPNVITSGEVLVYTETHPEID
ncbi:hypothetical protein PCASD_08501 [Puccinia coronata f. sp. avenae]|uniref:Uncharacterized protein n=1 Tax=Puccinia coronata f. sp. avenae TaxID=200324 RepID=A0A2N5TDC9_9BASI|nr:hypothetical protein PCASD_12050 [Puccinia coronata f. sp. avenae]PLW42695.1 hypothetical protein PCASD_08501 [Puccinia coronata f. sp. avenae]